MKRISLEEPSQTEFLMQKPSFRLEVTTSGPRFVMVDPAPLCGAPLRADCILPGVAVSAVPETFLPAPPSVPIVARQSAPSGAADALDLRTRPLAVPSVRELLELPAPPPSPTVGPSRGRHGRPARPMSKKRQRALRTSPGAPPSPTEPESAPPPPPDSLAAVSPVWTEPVPAPPPDSLAAVSPVWTEPAPPPPPHSLASDPPAATEPVPAPPPSPEMRSPFGPSVARTRSGPGRLVLDAPPLHSPDVLASVVSLSGSEQMLEARWVDPTGGLEVLTAPSAEPPTEADEAAIEEDEAAIEEVSEHAVADPTPRDMVEQEEPIAVPAPFARRQERYRPDAIPAGSFLVLALLVGIVALMVARLRPAPPAVSSPVQSRVHLPSNDRLLQPPVEARVEKALATGDFVLVMQGPDGKATQNLVGNLSFQTLAQAQEIARNTSWSLESPLFILRQAPPQERPIIADVVNPGDRAARLDFLLSEWQLKQRSLGLPAEGYASRASLDPNRTIVVMSNFIRTHPDSRLVEQALKDMQYVAFRRLQDPNKFYLAVQGLLDEGFRQMARNGRPLPELANLVNRYLQEAMNQRLYEQVHRYEGARAQVR